MATEVKATVRSITFGNEVKKCFCAMRKELYRHFIRWKRHGTEADPENNAE